MGDRERSAIEQPHGSDRSREVRAERITTELDWSDLVLPSSTIAQLRELEAKIRAEPSMTGGSGRSSRRRPGYKCLFHGPPGTGKTLAATLLGKGVNRDVYRIALSDVLIDTA
jgi:SpoVK/Ycf46/Vps4 family AAA+-type ATPase